ncbi:MAG TPA: hypothetical protein VGG33_22735, partial [Polyangia bacterium]
MGANIVSDPEQLSRDPSPQGPPRAGDPARDQAVWRENLRDECDGVALYEGLAALETDAGRAETLRSLAEAEKRHVAVWANKLADGGGRHRPSARVRALLFLARRLGTRAVLPLVMQAEARTAAKYQRQGADAIG